MKDQFVLLLNNSFLNSGIPRISGQFTADQTFHYKESALYFVLEKRMFLEEKVKAIGVWFCSETGLLK